MTQLQKADRMPPCKCRLMARKDSGRTGKSHADIAKETGLPKSTVSELSVRTSWEGVPMGIPDKFAAACGVNLERPSSAIKILRRRKLIWITNANGNQRRLYQKIFSLLKPRRS